MKGAYAVLAGCVLLTVKAAGLNVEANPVSRVVGLLKGLQEQAEKDMKVEEKMYKKFVCWGTTVIKSKEASNTEAETRLDALKQYVADIEAGKVEFTSERLDLEKEVRELTTELDTATAQREKEKADFDKAEEELKQGVKALEDAVKVLKEATEGNKKSGLLTVKSQLRVGVGFAARSAEAAVLSHAATLGEKVLSKTDARFLRRLLTGDVPNVSPKMNRKATFKAGYTTRSTKIQKLMGNLLKSFSRNLQEAQDKEKKAQEEFDELDKAKKEQLDTAEKALLNSEKEDGAKGQTKAEATDEINALETQVTDDTRYISETQETLDRKEGEWNDRKALRMGELAAFSKAIGVLHSDDARDLMAKSFKSQGYDFLQMSSINEARGHRAAAELRQVAKQTSDARLMALATRLVAGTKGFEAIEKVVVMIDKMVGNLKDEEAEELKNKEDCEKARAEDNRAAAVLSREIDELSDEMASVHEAIAEIDAEVADKNKQIDNINGQIKEATEQRKEQNDEFETAKSDDEACVALIKEAKKIMVDFYDENDLSFIAKKQAPPVGEAPEAPPPTWEKAGYGGKSGESNGIIAILEMIQDDVKKDIDKGQSTEEGAVKDFDNLKEDLEKDISDLEEGIGGLEGDKAEKEKSIESETKEQNTKKEDLETKMEKIKDEAPGCDFIAVNFDLRSDNRQIEMDGLVKAKAILQGASFDLLQKAAIKRRQ